MRALTARRCMGTLAAALTFAVPHGASASELTIGYGGIGNARLGTPLAALDMPLQRPIRKTGMQKSGQCYYAYPDQDKRFLLMFEANVLTRIDVVLPGLGTPEGVAVGDPVAKVRAVYGSAIAEAPDFYDDGERYLTVSSSDGKYAMRFTTSGGKVAGILSGTAKSVQYVEGCL